MTIREKEIRLCVRMRREGWEFAEIAAKLRRPEEHVMIFVRRVEPKLMINSKAWEITRRSRMVSTQEHDACGPQTLVTRFKAVAEAQRAGELKVLCGSLLDLAAAAMAWEHRLKSQLEAGQIGRPR